MGDSLGQNTGSFFRIGFAVGFVGFGEGICSVVGFGELGGLDGSGAFEGLAGFFALLLHSKGVGGLGVEVCCILILVAATAEEREASAGALGGFICLDERASASLTGSGRRGQQTFCRSALGSCAMTCQVGSVYAT